MKSIQNTELKYKMSKSNKQKLQLPVSKKYHILVSVDSWELARQMDEKILQARQEVMKDNNLKFPREAGAEDILVHNWYEGETDGDWMLDVDDNIK